MILVDTSIWVDHLRIGDPGLAALLEDRQVLIHPWVIGELALGHMSGRLEVIHLLRSLPHAVSATDAEVLTLIENQRLFGTGIGYVDAQLLASTLLTSSARLWTRDKRLKTVAGRAGVSADHLT